MTYVAVHTCRPSSVLALVLSAFLLLGAASRAEAQLLTRYQPERTTRIFYDTRAVTGHTTELTGTGQMKFIISHRFGAVSQGVYELFGLDQSSIRIGLDYGVNRWLDIGVGRNSLGKTLDGFAKVNVLRQTQGGSPIAATLLASTGFNGLRSPDPERPTPTTDRLSYAFQLHLARRVHDRLSVQLSPTLVHRNLVPTEAVAHDVLSLGATVRFLASRRVTITGQYYYVLPDQLDAGRRDFVGIGVDLETKGHVFQFYAGNGRGQTETLFVTETTGNVFDGDIHLGFNITRDFQLRGRKRDREH